MNKLLHYLSSVLSAVKQFVPCLYADYAVDTVKMFLLPTLDRRLGVVAERAVNDKQRLAVNVDILKLPEQSLQRLDCLACAALAENR